MTYGVNAPNGLQPRISLVAGAWNNQQNVYQILPGYATSIFTADPVSIGTDGTIKQGHDAAGIYLGVFFGCEFVITVPNAAGNVVFSPFWPASQPTVAGTLINAFVLDDPNNEYSIQFGGNGDVVAVFAQTMVGSNFQINLGTGNTLTGQSGASLGTAAQGAGANANFKILRLEPSVAPLQVLGNSFVNVVGVLNSDTFKGPVGAPS